MQLREPECELIPIRARDDTLSNYALNDLGELLRSKGIKARWDDPACASVAAGDFGIFIPLAQVLVPTFGACVIAWLKGHYGRKVRIVVGDDLKVEASTAEEIKALLRAAAQLKAAKWSTDDQKP